MNKVSVIVPVYNVEHYLRKCLDSLVNQTLPDIEILVIDDGSTDGSAEIIAEFRERFPLKIKNFYKENGGLSDARNFGLDRADAEFIAFVDSDDSVSENMFEEMYFLGKKHGADIVICNLQKVNESGMVIQKMPQIPNMAEKIVLQENFSVFSDISYFACNKIFKNNLFRTKRFKRGIHFEDIQLIPRLVLDSQIIAHTASYHYHYLERSGSISKTHTEKGLDILNAVNEVEVAFKSSQYAHKAMDCRNFQILEGIYTFLAYLAYVKDKQLYRKMSAELQKFIYKNNITVKEIVLYQRFGKNYLLSLPIRKKIYYLLYFCGQEKLLRKLV